MTDPIGRSSSSQAEEKQRYIAHARALVDVHSAPRYCYTNRLITWAIVKTEWRNGRWQKRTASARHGRYIAPDPKCGERNLDVALRAFESDPEAIGIAMLWHPDADIVCVDFDHMRDEFDEVNDRVIELAKMAGSDFEESISGQGGHIFGFDDDAVRAWGNRATRRLPNGQKVEIYSHRRMICRTFRQLPWGTAKLANIWWALQEIEADIGDTADHRDLVSAGLPASIDDLDYPRMKNEEELPDLLILKLLRNATNGPKFKMLFDRGDLSAYNGDHSSADQALACLIAYYAQNARQIERIFGLSALGQREKWLSRADYRIRTVGFAIRKNERLRS